MCVDLGATKCRGSDKKAVTIATGTDKGQTSATNGLCKTWTTPKRTCIASGVVTDV